MKNLLLTLKRRWIITLVGIALVAFATFWILGNVFEATTGQKIESNNAAAKTEVTEARDEKNQADDAAVERRVEDGVREEVIKPKLQAAREKSNRSKETVKNAKQKLNEKTENLHNSNASRDDNCAKLHRLYPNQRFEYCND